MELAYSKPRFFAKIPEAAKTLSFYSKYQNFNLINEGQVVLYFSAPLTANETDELNSLMSTFDVNFKDIKDVTPRQFRQAWVLSGNSLSEIDAFITSLSEPQKSLAFIEWEYSTVFQRGNATLNQLAPIFGVTDSQLDDLFILAATL